MDISRVPTTIALAVLIVITASGEPASANHRGSVEVRTTYESEPVPEAGGTGGRELSIEEVLEVPEGSLTLSGPITDGVEFVAHLGRWDIDVDEETIVFTKVSSRENGMNAAGAFDRYYFSFESTVSILDASIDEPGASAAIEEPSLVVVTLGPGYDRTGPGFMVLMTVDAIPGDHTVISPWVLLAAVLGLIGIASAATYTIRRLRRQNWK